MVRKVFITAPAHDELLTQLRQRGYEVTYVPHITYAELDSIIHEAEGLVVTTRIKLDKPILEKAGLLKWIGRLGSGTELIDISFAENRGVRVITTPEGNRNAVAEHVLGLILNLLNNITASHNQVKKGLWLRNENRGTELSGKTVGIIGYGNTGSTLASLLSSFNVTVLAYDKYKFGFGRNYIKEASLEQVCKYSDVISFHVPFTPETLHMANEIFFHSLQQTPVVVNASRGKVIDQEQLKIALETGKISGVALDVLENEKLETYDAEEQALFNWLAQHPKVIITPHIAGYSHEAFLRMGQVLIEKLQLNFL